MYGYEECDSRSEAEFRFERECAGYTVAMLADALGVRTGTVKRWENPKYAEKPSPRAWELVDSLYERLLRAVDESLDTVGSIGDETGEPPAVVEVAYRRGGKREAEPHEVLNAIARAVAMALHALGYEARAAWDGSATSGGKAAEARRKTGDGIPV